VIAAAAAPGNHAAAAADPAALALGHAILAELVGIDTTDSAGSTTRAADAMAARFRAAGFADRDISLLGPDPRRGNLVLRYRGRPGTQRKPLLIIGHLDVVEAPRADWSTDPFRLVERDGYYYGRGVQDMKGPDAVVVADLIRLKSSGFVPDRDIILALTADEEGGTANGVDWLLRNHRELIDAEYVLNPDGGIVSAEHGRAVSIEVEAAEKLYADYQLLATNPGGHSSRPTPDNAIYHVSDALAALQAAPFPFELNAVTRAYLGAMAPVAGGQEAADMRAILAEPPDPAAIARLSQDPRLNAILHTTCVPTMLSGGQAVNALPMRAEANVNCRILPGHSQEEVRLELVRRFADPTLTVRYRNDAGVLSDQGSARRAMTPPPPRADLIAAVRDIGGRLWPGAPVVPLMETVATDSIYTMQADMPSYGVSGLLIDRDDNREHARDERIRVGAFDDCLEFYYQLLQALTGGRH
jgi:acetylornithine deacetylase/succinyl-diaminopimelate desuccinylase-like protein